MKFKQIEVNIGTGRPVGLSNQELIYVRRAWHLARMSTEPKRHGALLVSGRKVLAVGVNTFRNDTKSVEFAPDMCSYHAEQNVLKQIERTSSDVRQLLAKSARLYVVRINRAERLMPSKPCAKCEAMLIAVGIKTVIHS